MLRQTGFSKENHGQKVNTSAIFLFLIAIQGTWKKKTFQIWMFKSDDDFLGGIAHEMLHFMFYEYAKELGFTQKQMWNLSEVINTILLNLSQYKRLFPSHVEKGYPAHSALIEKWKKLWTGDIDSFLKIALENKADFEL